MRARLGLPDGLLLGCYGRIRHQKGTDAFVDAMIDLCGRFEDVHGIVMGRATEKHTTFLAELKDKVAKAGLSDRILFMPEVTVDQIAEWYQVLDLFIAPQRWEGFGLTPLGGDGLRRAGCGHRCRCVFRDRHRPRRWAAWWNPAISLRWPMRRAEMLTDRDSLAQSGHRRPRPCRTEFRHQRRGQDPCGALRAASERRLTRPCRVKSASLGE